MNEVEERFLKALTPNMARQVTRIREKNTRFVHYTSAESGMHILRSGRMLLRNSTLLNDFSEVQHGMACLAHAYASPAGEKLKGLMKCVQEDLPEIFEASFNATFDDLRSETYIISLSEHGDPDEGDAFEDTFGRLSMWRAYANSNGIAFVFHNTPFASESDALHAFTLPVVYATPDAYVPNFTEIVHGVESLMDIIGQAGGQYFHDLMSNVFQYAIQSTKHPAFREEREWRVIYTPTVLARDGKLTDEHRERVQTEIMTLRGVPQRVYAIPFQNHPDDGLVGATVPELLDRVLIGPSPDAYAIAEAYVGELEGMGIADARSRVVITSIPLRT